MLTPTEVKLHGCTGLRVVSHDAGNANSIRLQIGCDGEPTLELLLFGMPKHVTDVLMRSFSDSETRDLSKVRIAMLEEIRDAVPTPA